MSMQFTYKAVSRINGSSARKPLIPITMIGPAMSIDTLALVDSGADISVISREVGEVLGMDMSGGIDWSMGVGGKVRTVEGRLRMRVSKGHERYSDDLPIKAIMDEYSLPPLLGRKGFFEHFEITFNEMEKKIRLKRLPP